MTWRGKEKMWGVEAEKWDTGQKPEGREGVGGCGEESRRVEE